MVHRRNSSPFWATICLKIGFENLNRWKKIDISLIVLSLPTKTRKEKYRPHYFKSTENLWISTPEIWILQREIDLGHQTQGFSLSPMWFSAFSIFRQPHDYQRIGTKNHRGTPWDEHSFHRNEVSFAMRVGLENREAVSGTEVWPCFCGPCQTDRTLHYLTIVRDLQSEAVIHVGNGKGVTALDGLSKKLHKRKLQVVAMDMSNAYASGKAFPESTNRIRPFSCHQTDEGTLG